MQFWLAQLRGEEINVHFQSLRFGFYHVYFEPFDMGLKIGLSSSAKKPQSGELEQRRRYENILVKFQCTVSYLCYCFGALWIDEYMEIFLYIMSIIIVCAKEADLRPIASPQWPQSASSYQITEMPDRNTRLPDTQKILQMHDIMSKRSRG